MANLIVLMVAMSHHAGSLAVGLAGAPGRVSALLLLHLFVDCVGEFTFDRLIRNSQMQIIIVQFLPQLRNAKKPQLMFDIEHGRIVQ